MIGLMVVLMMSFSGMVGMVLVLGQNYVALLKGSEMSAELHSRNLILGIKCFTISTLNV